jgi:transcription elongation factor GreA-like protein
MLPKRKHGSHYRNFDYKDIETPFEIGEFVEHETFGKGFVSDITKNVITIKFIKNRIGTRPILYDPKDPKITKI